MTIEFRKNRPRPAFDDCLVFRIPAQRIFKQYDIKNDVGYRNRLHVSLAGEYKAMDAEIVSDGAKFPISASIFEV